MRESSPRINHKVLRREYIYPGVKKVKKRSSPQSLGPVDNVIGPKPKAKSWTIFN